MRSICEQITDRIRSSSSMSIDLGSQTSAVARATCCLCPPLSWPPAIPTMRLQTVEPQ
ncbi:hypothetical protein BDV10DRAFT_174839 [Aspergillus recurvatus]